jgi:hypothetical protein
LVVPLEDKALAAKLRQALRAKLVKKKALTVSLKVAQEQQESIKTTLIRQIVQLQVDLRINDKILKDLEDELMKLQNEGI